MVNYTFIACGNLAAIFYILRYRHIQSRIVYSEDLLYLTILVVILAAWNIVILLSSAIHSKLNDAYIFIITLVSILLFKNFSLAIVRVVEMISFRIDSNATTFISNRDDLEGNRKSVTFDDTKVVLSYSEENSSVTYHPVRVFPSIDDWKYWTKKCAKILAIYLFTMVSCIILLPRSMMFVSTKTLFYYNDSFYIKTDHALFALEIEFVIFMVGKFNRVLKHPHFKHFPYITAIATIFIWVYSGALLLVNINCIIIFNDIISIMKDPELYIADSDNFISMLSTSLILTWLDCSADASTLCNNENAKVQFIREIMRQTWSVVNSINFLLVPLIIWIVIIEIRFRRACV
ncbi:hypothetical protein CLIB1423_05S05094 [[Candida] railenensis]|uniref:Uncharacterized protein n=1 Tax=[Candida] railenensis TaxID=45579 RepID=A0A9P0QMN5_9ASCO|nr:hypothetical protein CLIB1423_05S05094 [[Candida] railenensis]